MHRTSHTLQLFMPDRNGSTTRIWRAVPGSEGDACMPVPV